MNRGVFFVLILKGINNNVALAVNDRSEECVVFGNGVGFSQVWPYELEDESVIKRVFTSVRDSDSIAEALRSISDEVLLASYDISAIARERLDCKLSPNLPFVVADHLQFAVERTDIDILIHNPLESEVAFLYPRECEIGREGIDIVEKYTGVRLPDSEETCIALHLVNAELDGMGNADDMDFLFKSTAAVEQSVKIVEAQLRVTLDRRSYPFVRFVAHLRYLIKRLMKGKEKPSENSSLFRQAARDFPDSYRCAIAINNYLLKTYNWACSDEELLYLMMHINRLRTSGLEKEPHSD